MIEVSRPKLNRFKYAAMLLGAMAVVAAPLASPAIAPAQPNTASWDMEAFDNCLRKIDRTRYPGAQFLYDDYLHNEIMKCCIDSGGVWGVGGKCEAPPSDTQGSRQLPGNIQIPSDIATAPTVTKDPPIRVPSDIATVSTVSQGNQLAS